MKHLILRSAHFARFPEFVGDTVVYSGTPTVNNTNRKVAMIVNTFPDLMFFHNNNLFGKTFNLWFDDETLKYHVTNIH